MVERPPAPVTAAEHGVCAEPLNVTDDSGHVINVDDDALSITNDDWVAVDPLWLLSPANDASAVAVPAFVFAPYVTEVDADSAAPVTWAEHGV